MKKTKIAYWVFTILFSMMMLGSAIPDILIDPVAVEGFTRMGMPVYLIPFVGYAKLLGVIAILFIRNERIKEWAYAGLVFDLLGATYSIIAAGFTVKDWGFMIIPLFLAAGSYVFYLKKLKLAGVEQARVVQAA